LSSAEAATAACVVIAPMVTLPPPTVIPVSPGSAARSTMAVGDASRIFIVGSRVMPPERRRFSPLAASRATASDTVDGL